VDSLLPELGRLASLQPTGPVRIARRTAAQVRQYVAGRLDEELPPAEISQLKDVYALLGLVPDTLDLRGLLLELYSEQIVGYYDPHERTLFVVEGIPRETLAPVLAHELVHAIQDQHANLDSLISRERGNDRQEAAHAAIEGHATVVMFAFLAEQAQGARLDPATLPNPAPQLAAGLSAENEQFPVFRGAPDVIRETMLFPYVGGADFVYRLWHARPRSRPAPLGEWLPQSTEQVLHPVESFLTNRDEPTTLTPPDPPPGWAAVGGPDQLGELETGIFLGHYLGDSARTLARGWDGDAYRLLVDSEGNHALVWSSVWDDASAAASFADALRKVANAAPGRAYRIRQFQLQGRPAVQVLIASNPG